MTGVQTCALPICHLFLDFTEPADIIADGVLIVGRAGAYNHKEFVGLTGNDIFDKPIITFGDGVRVRKYRWHPLTKE